MHEAIRQDDHFPRVEQQLPRWVVHEADEQFFRLVPCRKPAEWQFVPRERRTAHPISSPANVAPVRLSQCSLAPLCALPRAQAPSVHIFHRPGAPARSQELASFTVIAALPAESADAVFVGWVRLVLRQQHPETPPELQAPKPTYGHAPRGLVNPQRL